MGLPVMWSCDKNVCLIIATMSVLHSSKLDFPRIWLLLVMMIIVIAIVHVSSVHCKCCSHFSHGSLGGALWGSGYYSHLHTWDVINPDRDSL